eukprot:65085_1
MSMWNILQKLPYENGSNPIRISENEYWLFPTNNIAYPYPNVLCYSTQTNTFSSIYKYKKNQIIANHHCLKWGNTIYITNTNSKILTFTADTHKVNELNLYQKDKNDQFVFGGGATFWVDSNGTFHVLGGLESVGEFKFNSTHSPNKIYIAIGKRLSKHKWQYIRNGSVVKNKEDHYFFGGCSSFSNNTFKGIWKCNQVNAWNKLNVQMPKGMHSFGTVSIGHHQRLIACFGGIFKNNILSDKIYIFDTLYHQWKLLSIKLPKKGACATIIMKDEKRNDDLIGVGWIKTQFGLKSFSGLQLPPMYLMAMIIKYIKTINIYVVQKQNTGHFKISEFSLLNNNYYN